MESMNDALLECVNACGGSKQVAAALFPAKAPDAAQRALLDALNEDRPAFPHPDHVLQILRMARARGCHAGMEFIAAQLHYAPPVPVQPVDQLAELQRDYIEATRTLAQIAARIETLAPVVPVVPHLSRAA